MNDQLNVSQKAGVEVIRAPKPSQPSDKLNAKGRFKVEHWRGGVMIGEYDMPNAITDEGRKALLNVMFFSGTEVTSWWMGIVDSTGYTSLAAGDTYAQIGGINAWTEYTHYTDYNNSNSGSTRPQWDATTATVTSHVASVSNTVTTAIFVITSGGSGLVKGLFLVGTAGGTSPSQTKSDNTSNPGVNILWSAALFTGGDVTILTGDQLKVTYTVSA